MLREPAEMASDLPQKVRHFARRGDAEHFLDAIRGDTAHGMDVDPAAGRHLWPDSEEETRNAVDLVLGGLTAAM